MMTISRMTVDKLGVKLYDKVSAVIAELIANSYDADATEVKVTAPMGEFLAARKGGELQDKGFEIIVEDNGIGMHPDVVNQFYLTVGKERRDDPARGNLSPNFGRKVMGRKGIGKLAPFGICQRIEVITTGGERIQQRDKKGKIIGGHPTAHFILSRDGILQETDKAYYPEIGNLDGAMRSAPGTVVKLSKFYKRQVPTSEQFERQLAHRFGIKSSNWKIVLFDSTKTPSDLEFSREVGEFSIHTMENTKIRFEGPIQNKGGDDPNSYRVISPDGEVMPGPLSGFHDEDGKFYPVTGWLAYASQPYRDELMAGIRIYCRGKIAAQTHVFDRKAGFTGEHDVRSYLVGELHADWLDATEDLIQTDRRNIQWSHDLGQRFQEWGQQVVLLIGRLSRNPMRKKVWDEFMEIGKVEERINKAFPREEYGDIRRNAWDLIEQIGSRLRREELEERERVNNFVQLGIMFAPHITLNEKLKQAADKDTTPLSYVSSLLRTARMAELSSFGRIAEDRIKVIEKLTRLRDDPTAEEKDFQELIQAAPWLIDPQWSPIAANQAFSTLKKALEKHFQKTTGKAIKLNDFADSNKRPDFVLSNEGRILQLIEIKKPDHVLKNEEMDRIIGYVHIMKTFLGDPANKEFLDFFDGFHISLVCEKENLSGAQKEAFLRYQEQKLLTWINWSVFFLRTQRAHQAFLDEAERQRRYGGD
jgi:hypothetical protein